MAEAASTVTINLLRLIALLLGLATLAAGLWLTRDHGDILGDAHLVQERGMELLPAAALLVSGLVTAVGAIAIRRGPHGLVHLLIGAGVLLFGAVAAEALIRSGVQPQRTESEVLGPLVEVVRVESGDVALRVSGSGEVRARRQTQIVPQVEGRVVRVHENLVTGGLVPAGEVLVEIDSADFDLALKRAATDVREAEAATETARSRIEELTARLQDVTSDVARLESLSTVNERELDKARIQLRIVSALLAVAESEYAAAEARRESANLAVRRAQLDLGRTKVSLDFDAVVMSERVDPGQFVTRGQSIAELYATDAVEVPVRLVDRELQWLERIPVAGMGQVGSGDAEPIRAEVRTEFAGRVVRWNGRVARVEAQVDPRSRMVTAVVEVTDPLRRVGGSPSPLVPGMFVEVEIEGRTLHDVFPVPRHSVHEGDEVWVVRDGRLWLRKVSVGRRDRDTVYITDGLESGELVVVSPMDAVTDGMSVRIAGEPSGEGIVDGASPRPAPSAGGAAGEP